MRWPAGPGGGTGQNPVMPGKLSARISTTVAADRRAGDGGRCTEGQAWTQSWAILSPWLLAAAPQVTSGVK